MQTLAQLAFSDGGWPKPDRMLFFRRGQPGPVGCPSERLEFPLARLSHSPARSDFSENEWICRDLLIAAFPDTVGRWTVEELLKMDTMELLLETGEQDPNTAIQMMKLLLDTAEEHLQETEAAEQLLGNDLYDFCQNESIQPKLLAQLKQDDRLARQLFQSAYADSPQEELIAACDRLGEQTLKAHLQTLLDQNPFC